MPDISTAPSSDDIRGRSLAKNLLGRFELVRVLGKNPQNTHIVIQEIEREDWGHGGELVADRAPASPGKA